ncbi:MAG TPA: protease pro-enzyme activation domain-containing protein [Bryobacteraceae bacterium]|nr:protease pro-enzyme activation domain-containing protein [Bryobacteraceae bacterium]
MLQRNWARLTGRGLILFLFWTWTGSLSAQVSSRITQAVDERALVLLAGSVHPLVAGAVDLGRVRADLPIERALLYLSASAEQEAELEALLVAQQDPGAAEYHQWLTPEQFGERFGVSDADLQTITAWLASQGLQVTAVASGRRTIEFGGTARQVEQTFHTEIHEFQVAGERRVANATELAIPQALRPVIAGVVSLNNFPRRPMYRVISRGPGESGGHYLPITDLTGGGHALSPYDFATIYDVAGLWNNGFDGTGQTIGIAGRTNLKLTDVASFRTQFGLPAKAPQVIVNGTDPGIISSAEETEADLDVEWSGAVAKGATVAFVVSASTAATDGIDLSSSYLVNNNLASAISVSFGECEAEMGAGNAFYNSLWQQAAAQGISVFVAAGDSGSAGCDAPESSSGSTNSTAPASHGFAVSGLASTPYNVAVGGTEFNDPTASVYWNSSNNTQEASAKSYIPEVVWNESSYTTAGAAANGLWAGAGGVSTLYATPTWQTGTGVPTVDPAATTHHRYLPDVALSAAGHDGYLIVQEGSLYLVGGTSASSPSFAGILAMVDQYSGGRNGNPNARFYPLAAKAPSVYHDVTTGNNEVPCTGGSPNCSAAQSATSPGKMNGYAAGAGYDLASGWGSVDAYELALNWGATPVATGPTITTLSPNPMTGSSSTQTLTITGAGFTAGTGLMVVLTSGSTTTTYQGAQITSAGATQIQVAVSPGTAAQNWTVSVVNPNGKASNGMVLQVVAPAAAPTITSLSPNPMTGSASTATLTIAGTGFTAGTGMKVVLTSGSTSATYQGTQIISASATQILVVVSPGTAAQNWTVTVVNPNGQASNGAVLQVTAPAAPAITSLSPNPMTGSNAYQILTINGTGFTATTGWKVVLSGGGTTVTLPASQISVKSATQILAQVNVGTTAQTWSVQVGNPSGVVSNTASLTVTAPAAVPAITSLAPNPMTKSAAAQTLTVNGAGFQSGSGLTVKLTSGGVVITVPGSAIQFVSSSQLTMPVNVGAFARTYSVTVGNPSGQISNAVNLTVQ